MKTTSYNILILGLLLIAASACSKGTKPSADAEPAEVIPENIVELRDDQVRLAKIELGSVEMRSIGNVLKVNGLVTVSPQNQASVCMPMGGFVKSTSLVAGSAVRRGQVLAVIENQDFVDIQQSYLEAKNKLVFAEAEYKRHTSLFKDDVYSEQNLQEVTVEYKNLKGQVTSLGQKLGLIGIDAARLTEDNISGTVNLLSPISGFLRSVNVNTGKYVSPTDVLFEIVNIDKLLLELTVFEKDAGKIQSGQKIVFFINNETEEHEAIVTQTGKSVGSDKSFRFYAAVNSECENLLPGMYVNAQVSESAGEVPALPSAAVVSFDDKFYIFAWDRDKEEDGKPFTEYRMIEVKKGPGGGGWTAVEAPAGEDLRLLKIVVKGAYNLLSAKKNAGEMAC